MMGVSCWFVKTLGEQDIVRYQSCTNLPDCSKLAHSLQFYRNHKEEAYFDLISSPSPYVKIQIMDGKITENLGFESQLQKVKKKLSFFFS